MCPYFSLAGIMHLKDHRGRLSGFPAWDVFLRMETTFIESLNHVRLFATPMDCSPPRSTVHEDFPGKNTGVGCHAPSGWEPWLQSITDKG